MAAAAKAASAKAAGPLRCLIPFVPSIVTLVDVPNGSIWVDPPEGLLDLAVVKVKEVRIRALLSAAPK
jgi:hypothetical protein